MLSKSIFSVITALAAITQVQASSSPPSMPTGVPSVDLVEISQQLQNVPDGDAIVKLYSQYGTANGFDKFTQALAQTAMGYLATQTYMTAAPTSGNINPENPEIRALGENMQKLIVSFVSSETYLPKDVHTSLVHDLMSIQSVASTATYRKPISTEEPTPSAEPSSNDNSSSSPSSNSSPTTSTTSSHSTSSPSSSSAAGMGKVISISAVIVGGISALAIFL